MPRAEAAVEQRAPFSSSSATSRQRSPWCQGRCAAGGSPPKRAAAIALVVGLVGAIVIVLAASRRGSGGSCPAAVPLSRRCLAPFSLPGVKFIPPPSAVDASSYGPGDEIYFHCESPTHALVRGAQGCAVCVRGEWTPDPGAGEDGPACVVSAQLPVPGNTSGTGFYPLERRTAKCNLATGQATRTGVHASYLYANLALEAFPGGAPWLDPRRVRTDGLAFVGLSMTRNHLVTQPLSNGASVTRQTQFDFNDIQDRK